MPNKSHFNSGHMTLNRLNRIGRKPNGTAPIQRIEKTLHSVYIEDAVSFLKRVPDSSIQLIILDPPYNLNMDVWDSFNNYLDWAKAWLDQIYRVLSDTGNCVIFGGFQYQDLKHGDLLEILHHVRHNTDLLFVNLIIWYYKNGMSAHRFFANRHEEVAWLAKTKHYYFELDSVRIPFDEETKRLYRRDKRLNPASIEKGKNPTNVWEINRLNANSKERVGHPTQKPLEIIRRFVRALSCEGSLVLDFFAGSGTTGRVCVEEGRHSILVDSDAGLMDYFNLHLKNSTPSFFNRRYEIVKDVDVSEFIDLVRGVQCVVPSQDVVADRSTTRLSK
jgi:site-specific DNA-methyltransferase (adenine-specific)